MKHTALIITLFIAGSSISHSALTITLTDTPSGVAISVSGSLLIPENAPLFFSGFNGGTSINIDDRFAAVGPGSGTSAPSNLYDPAPGLIATVPDFSPLFSPANNISDFSPGGVTTGLDGDYYLFSSNSGAISLGTPAGYISGTFVSDSGLIAGESFSSIGLNPNVSVTATYPVNTSGGTDRFIVRTLDAIPEPHTTSMIVVSCILGTLRRSRNK